MRPIALSAAIALVALVGCGSPAASSLSATAPGTTAAASVAAKPQHAATASSLAKAMGIKHFTAYTEATDPNKLMGRQREYTSKINWKAGSIEVFASHVNAASREVYLQAFSCPLGDGYDLLDGVALLRLSCDVTPSQAKSAEKKFRKVVG